MDLNPSQQAAVAFNTGPLLVLAGAGAGKTRVLTQRVHHLIQHHRVHPSRILVVTFTNKAAREMKSRLEQLLGEKTVQKVWMGTFHGVCLRLLRQEIERLGYARHFVIYDPTDQEKFMKTVMAQLDLDPRETRPRQWLKKISGLKSQGLLPVDYRKQDLEFHELTLLKLYETYQEQMALHNALDFDDLLLLTLQLLKRFPDLQERYGNHFQYVLIDEYQDTNPLQFEVMRLLAQPQNNIFVVGDVDQSIYSFRHADFQIILRFQNDYANAACIKLQENYRSTRAILEAANTLIEHNRDRFDKVLIGTRGQGSPINLKKVANEYQEADFVIAEIRKLQQFGQYDYGDMCVLYRTNAQSRLFEERLVQGHIPHQVLGAFRFYERKEIKDLMAYLSVLYNPLDTLNLRRIINTPKRGLGIKTLQNLDREAERQDQTLWDALSNTTVLEGVSKKAQKTLIEWVTWLKKLRSESLPLATLIERIYLESGYEAELASDEESFESRDHNIQAFIQAAREFKTDTPEQELGDFLQHLALLSDVDSLKEKNQLVRLMTVHAAKGLEYPVVFVTGLEEGIFPHMRSIESENNGDDQPIEEERRLMYVAMTRAENELYLSCARKRMQHGEAHYQEASRFLEEIEAHLPKGNKSKSSDSFSSSSFSPLIPVPELIQDPVEVICAGDTVLHPDFGQGKVEKVYQSGSRSIAIIVFSDGYGKRILDLRTAPLQKV